MPFRRAAGEAATTVSCHCGSSPSDPARRRGRLCFCRPPFDLFPFYIPLNVSCYSYHVSLSVFILFLFLLRIIEDLSKRFVWKIFVL